MNVISAKLDAVAESLAQDRENMAVAEQQVSFDEIQRMSPELQRFFRAARVTGKQALTLLYGGNGRGLGLPKASYPKTEQGVTYQVHEFNDVN